nr:uncharacterized protein LOC109750694 [Aegilops tauschii subsp. strangulata]
MQVLPSQLEANVDFMPDRDVSDVADPDLGAAALEDDATGGGGGSGGFRGGGGGVDDWLDDEEEEEEAPRHPPPADRTGPITSVAPTAPSGGPKRRGVLLFGSHPKKPKHSATAAKNTAAATKRCKAATKAAKFHKAPKQPPMVSAAPVSLERSTSASVVRMAQGSTNTRRIDPAADLREALERNAREVWEEKEAAAKEAEADKAAAAKVAQADADAAAQAQADATTKKRAAGTAYQQIPLLITPCAPRH